MADKYYYLVASLSSMEFGGTPPVSEEGFLAECAKWLSERDMKALLSAGRDSREDAPEDPEVLRDWKIFDRALRKDLARIRDAQKKSGPVKGTEQLRGVLEAATPLLKEKELERIRWDFIRDKSAAYQFDTNWLVVYFLRLRINIRLSGFDKDKGENIFYNLCEVIYEQAKR